MESIILNEFQTHKSLLDMIARKSLLQSVESTIHYDKDHFDTSDNNLTEIFAIGYLAIHTGDKGFVYFVRDSYFGFTQGLVFSVEGVEPRSPYFTEIRQLDENWFLFKMK